MKTTTKTIAIAIITVLSVLSTFINTGCGIDNITGSNKVQPMISDSPADSIQIAVTKVSGGYEFNLINNSQTTIVNDFHVQFDTTVSIIDWSLLWQFDPNTTNLSKGKIGEKAGPGQQPILPHQQHQVLWVKVQFNGKKIIKDFDWQATRDGVTVQSGSSTLPD